MPTSVASCGCKSGKTLARTRTVADKEFSDSIANIAKFDPAVEAVGEGEILGLVIYDLPGRDCAAKASNGELKYNELDKYKTQYIDRMLRSLPALENR